MLYRSVNAWFYTLLVKCDDLQMLHKLAGNLIRKGFVGSCMVESWVYLKFSFRTARM